MANNENTQKTALIERLRQYTIKRYEQIVDYIQQDDCNIDDVELFINEEANFFDTVRAIKRKNKDADAQKEFEKKVNNKTTFDQIMLDACRDQIRIITEAKIRAELDEAYTPKDIATKENKIKRYDEKLERLHTIEQRLENLVRELLPEKRKVGRPRKTGENLNQENENVDT